MEGMYNTPYKNVYAASHYDGFGGNRREKRKAKIAAKLEDTDNDRKKARLERKLKGLNAASENAAKNQSRRQENMKAFGQTLKGYADRALDSFLPGNEETPTQTDNEQTPIAPERTNQNYEDDTPEKKTNWTLIGGVGISIVVIALVAYFATRN